MRISDTRARVTIRRPAAWEIRVRPFTYRPDKGPPRDYWYLELSESADICIGADDEDLLEDLEAMRALQRAAGEAAAALTDMIKQRENPGA